MFLERNLFHLFENNVQNFFFIVLSTQTGKTISRLSQKLPKAMVELKAIIFSMVCVNSGLFYQNTFERFSFDILNLFPLDLLLCSSLGHIVE